MSAIRLNNVGFAYKDNNLILKDVNLTLDYNNLVLIAGHSGEGKSTILGILTGIIPNIVNGNLTGEVYINDVNINDKKINEICRSVGVVIQDADMQIIQKYVGDEIAFGCENLAFKRDIIQRQIDITTKLLDLDKNAICHSLSGGEKQRLSVASTLAMGQRIIILDEPLANLDYKAAHNLMNILAELKKSCYLVIVIEHRLDIVLPYADKVFNLENKALNKILDYNSFLIKQSTKISDSCKIASHNDKILSLNNISYKIKNKEILSNINLDIYKGERLLILGENGCGKTTLLRIISKIIKPSNGSINNYNPNKKKKWYDQVGVIFQNPNYELFMPTVEKEIKFKAFSLEYADEIAELFDIKRFYHRHPGSLSLGERRLVSIAAILARKPEILILDEPTVGEDYNKLCQMINVLNEIHQKTNNTMITITHDIRCASAICDRAIWIKNKEIYKIGNKELVDDFFSNL